MNVKRVTLSLITIFSLSLLAAFDPSFSVARAQGKKGPPPPALQVGYVVVTASIPGNLAVFETFGANGPNQMPQAGVLPSDLTTKSMVFVTTSNRFSRNLGLAIANPQPANGVSADVTFKLRDSEGNVLASKTITVAKGAQTAQFITQLFPDQPSVQTEFNGTVEISSSVAVATVGLRFRGINFSTIPVTATGPIEPVPLVKAGVGGPGAVVLPQFADGEGWASEIVFTNVGADPITVEADFFDQQGNEMNVTLNGVTASKFTTTSIPANGLYILAPGNASGDPF